MENNLLFDSSILIDYLRGDKLTQEFVDELLDDGQATVAVSGITELELYAGKSLDKPKEKHRVDVLFDQLLIFPVTSVVLRKAGELKRHFNISLGDAIIAATAIEEKFIVVTTDPDFSKIPGIKCLTPAAAL